MSIQDRMAQLLAEETPSVIGQPAGQFVKNLKAAEAEADKMVAAFDKLGHADADDARERVQAFKKAAGALKQYAEDLLKY